MKDFDKRLGRVEGELGIKRKRDPDQERKARVIDDWLEVVTGRRITEMSCAELARLERLFRGDELRGDDASDLVLACMDEDQIVVDLEQRRQQLDQWPNR